MCRKASLHKSEAPKDIQPEDTMRQNPTKILFPVILCLIPALAPAETDPTPVSVVTVRQGNMPLQAPLAGTVTALKRAHLSTREQGYIEAVLVDEGDRIQQGDPLLSLDRELSDIALRRVTAELDEARARLKEFRRQRAEAARLREKNHIAKTALAALVAEVEVNLAVVAQLEAELARQKVINGRQTLYAPFAGVITEKMAEVGQWVDTRLAVFQLTALDPLRIEVQAPQFYFNRIDVGAPVTIKYDALPGREFSAGVSAKVPVSDPGTRAFPLMIQVDNGAGLITPGMSARVFITLSGPDTGAALMAPRDAIILKPDGGSTVWRVETTAAGETAAPVPVETGSTHLNQIEITAGDIKAGDRVVVRGNELLRPGQRVNIIAAPADDA